MAITNPQTLIDNYREALRACYGDEIADKSRIDYSKGWFYVALARRFPDGSIGIIDPANGKRAKRIIEMTQVLLNRVAPRLLDN